MMRDIHARAPINKVAAIVVMSKGVQYNPNKRVQANDSETPHKIRLNIPLETIRCQHFEDLTGMRRGRLLVIGLSDEFPGRWVVRCDCGRYSMRRKKAITNSGNEQDRCEHCRHLAFLRWDEAKRRTGKDQNINNF